MLEENFVDSREQRASVYEQNIDCIKYVTDENFKPLNNDQLLPGIERQDNQEADAPNLSDKLNDKSLEKPIDEVLNKRLEPVGGSLS